MAATHSVVLYDPRETSAEVKAAAGFLAGYSGRTRDAYTLDLRQFYGWCDRHHLQLFEVTRTHTSSSTPESSRNSAGRRRRSAAACQQWRASTATPRRRA